MKIEERGIEIAMIAGLLLLGFVAVKGIKGAAGALTRATIDAATGVVTGVVDEVGQSAGLPPLADITTDAGVARWIIDAPGGGYLAASQWSSALAYAHALVMSSGSGTPPVSGSAIDRHFSVDYGVGSAW